MDVLDSAKAVRAGEELDTERLRVFLEGAVAGLEGDLEVLQFPSGFSNLTYLTDWVPGPTVWHSCKKGSRHSIPP
jgi:aminoglycoside phosphotransferase (APT) family kinase protein